MSEREERRRQREVIELVTFPASKNYPVLPPDLGPFDDPLEELLNEFGPYDADYDEDALEALSDLSQDELLRWLGFEPDELELLAREDALGLMREQVSLLVEIGLRLKYYLDEIEHVLPLKR
jgi:hypothetical protein